VNKKMTAVMDRLRFDWMRRRGDFIRPRGVPLDAWRRMSEGERRRHLMKRVGA
jgi:hypothetical protein